MAHGSRPLTVPAPAEPPVRPSRWLGSPVRRALDVTIAAAALALGAPVLLLAIVVIRLESRGPAIFRQRRVGRDGEPFELFKLRTMVSGAETMGPGLALDAGDARITRVGAILRRTSLDELPNLVNVLRGEMAIIGPRPTVRVQVDRYTDRQRGRLAILPGLTGWAQVNGRAALPWSERIELDLFYVERASPLLDARILLVSVRMVLTGTGIYKGPGGGWGR